MSQIHPDLKVGILGGGQLARMLALSAHPLGLTPAIYTEHADDPAAVVAPVTTVAGMADAKALKAFLAQVDVATFESEFLNADLLKKLSQETGTRIYPAPEIMGQLQDRLTQKTLLNTLKISTADWFPVNTEESCDVAARKLGLPLVFKKRRFGYDGYGTFVVKTTQDLEKFKAEQIPNPDGFIAEKWVPFKRELACMFARNVSGQIVHYPLVESFQKNSRCFWVKGPIAHPKFKTWVPKFKKLLEHIQYVGVMGVEFFDTRQGLIVNELAPRVHNSGHYTQEAFSINQFELHLRCLLDQPLTLPPANGKGFAMVNLLGGEHTPEVRYPLSAKAKIHWYGKKQSRPGRKMGHINVVDSTPQAALKEALKALRGIDV